MTGAPLRDVILISGRKAGDGGSVVTPIGEFESDLASGDRLHSSGDFNTLDIHEFSQFTLLRLSGKGGRKHAAQENDEQKSKNRERRGMETFFHSNPTRNRRRIT